MKTLLVQDVRFGHRGNALAQQRSGWSDPEDGYTWAVGDRAEVLLNVRPYRRYMLEFFASPCINERYPTQNLIVCANGTPVSSVTMDTHEAFACMIDPEHIAGDVLLITFDMPNSVRPCDISVAASSDDRKLGFRFSRLRLFEVHETTAPPKVSRREHTMLSFESLGENCDLGRYQRDIGLEPLGLLRFSGQPISCLIEALDEKFRAFDNIENVFLDKDMVGGVYDILVRPYGMFYHTFIDISGVSEERLRLQQHKYLRFLRNKFIEEAETGDKIFIYRRKKHIKPSEVLALYAAMNRIGRINMLALGKADASHPGGTVEVVMPGLYYGYVTSFREAPMDPLPCRDEWAAVCQRTLDLAAAH